MRLAIIGGGQLARMLALDGWRLGIHFTFLVEPGENYSCVNGLGDVVELDKNMSADELFKALGKPDVLTVEKEHVDADILNMLADKCRVAPNADAVKVTQHRGREKNFLRSLDIQTAPYQEANSKPSLASSINKMGLPVLVKSSEEGYDGRGQWMLRNDDDLKSFLAEDDLNRDFVIEGLVDFDKECSMIAARSADGDCVFYPLTDNVHKNGILLTSYADTNQSDNALTQSANAIAKSILNKLDYVGVLAIEFFVIGNQLIVNELAPRVHNSGHWSQATDVCSQFENHLRAVFNLPLGDTQPSTHVAMVNLLGVTLDKPNKLASNMQLHEYNKEPRPNRKIGHINIWHESLDELKLQVKNLLEELY